MDDSGLELRKNFRVSWLSETLSDCESPEPFSLLITKSISEYNQTNIFNLVNPETAAFLHHPETPTRCPLKLTISAEEGCVLSAVSVLSESRTAEVYIGKFEEYASTSKAIQTSSIENISLSVIAVMLERPTSLINLKLSGLDDPMRCMMFAAVICQEKLHPSPVHVLPSAAASATGIASLYFEALVDRKIQAFESRFKNHLDTKLGQTTAIVEQKVENLVNAKLDEVEKRLEDFVEEKLGRIERNICERLDRILSLKMDGRLSECAGELSDRNATEKAVDDTNSAGPNDGLSTDLKESNLD